MGGLDFSLDFGENTGPDRPVRETKDRLQKAKKREWLRKEIQGGIADAVRKACDGSDNADR